MVLQAGLKAVLKVATKPSLLSGLSIQTAATFASVWELHSHGVAELSPEGLSLRCLDS